MSIKIDPQEMTILELVNDPQIQSEHDQIMECYRKLSLRLDLVIEKAKERKSNNTLI